MCITSSTVSNTKALKHTTKQAYVNAAKHFKCETQRTYIQQESAIYLIISKKKTLALKKELGEKWLKT